MNYRDVLTKLDHGRNSGWDHFDSMCVAGLLGCGVARSSKWLFRLHSMGFLKRRRLKRRCVSKGRRLCNKGYYYEYRFSRQGEKYLRWLKETRPYEDALYGIMLSAISSHLPEDIKKAILSTNVSREKMRFKGSNRSLSALGVLTPTLLPILEELSSVNVKKEEAQRECVRLRETVDEQASKIMTLDNANKSLKRELDLKYNEVEDMKKLYQGTTETFVKRIISSSQEASFWDTLNRAKSGIIRDLTEVMTVMNPEGTPKLIELVYKRHDKLVTDAAEKLELAEATNNTTP